MAMERLALWLLLLYTCFTVTTNSLQIDQSSLHCNGLTAPLGLPTTRPRLSWIPVSSKFGDTQTAYQIQASSDGSFDPPNLWDTQKIISSNFSVVYGGKTLGSRDRAYWRVRSWDVHGEVGPWSDASWFELALMQQDDWKANWITNEQYVTGQNGLPIFAKAFNSSCAPKRARLYYIGLGVQWAALNGAPVTDEVLLPSYSTMNTTLFYNSYDVTKLVLSGENVLVVELGKGVYDAEQDPAGRYTKFVAANTPLPLKLLAQLEYTCLDGSKGMVLSDNTWQTTTSGPRLESSWYGGEEYDARRDLSSYYSPLSDRSDWIEPNVTTSPYPGLHPELLSPQMPPLKIIETLACVFVSKTNVSYVFDFGQNFAGWYLFNFQAKLGHRITLWPSEILFANGSADQSTTGSPIFDGYTFAGDGIGSYSPKFMYHGFRYLEVFGLLEAPSIENMTGHRIRFDAAPTGQFRTNIQLFNKIHGIIDQAVQNQMYSVLTDCPQREKMGWLDQQNLASAPVLFAYDFRGFGRHMVKQTLDAQNQAGEVPTTAPQLTEFGSWPPYGDGFDQAPNWGISIVLFAWEHYQMYGDIEVLGDCYEGMKKYIDYLTAMNATTHILWSGLGDWEAIDQTTPFGVTATSAYARSVGAMVAISSILGHESDAMKYATLHKEILTAFQTTFFNTTHNATTYGSGSQACDAIALNIGAVPPQYVNAIYENLANSIRNNGTHVTVGEVGLPAVVNSLSTARYDNLLYDLMISTTYPSYGFLVDHGATSMTEYWDGPLGTGSQDHIILDYGDTWLTGLSGVKQAEGSIAWQSIDFEPVIVGNITAVTTTFNSVKGVVAGSWELNNKTFIYNVTVPVGSLGTVYLPGSMQATKLEGSTVERHPGVQSIHQNGHQTVVQIGSGTYCFTTIIGETKNKRTFVNVA